MMRLSYMRISCFTFLALIATMVAPSSLFAAGVTSTSSCYTIIGSYPYTGPQPQNITCGITNPLASSGYEVGSGSVAAHVDPSGLFTQTLTASYDITSPGAVFVSQRGTSTFNDTLTL